MQDKINDIAMIYIHKYIYMTIKISQFNLLYMLLNQLKL